LAASKQHGFPRYETLQNLYNLYDREDFEKNLAPLLLQENISAIPYYGLASGFLTGKYRTEADLQKSPRGGGVGQKYLNEKGLALLIALDAVADRQQATPAQVALAWLMQAPTVTAPIASATSVSQVTELLEATELRLTTENLQTLEQAQPATVAKA
jgi:aryl-alcohol dehydrogenase-like predicted oxidoreductase